MMQKLKLLAAILAIFAAPLSYAAEGEQPSGGAGAEGGEHAEKGEKAEKGPLSANVSLVSNYLYRGISQTGGKPAIQGGFDYEHSSGLYAGVFGSNSSFFANIYQDSKGAQGATNSSLEVDTYFGFKNHFAGDFNYDVGFLRYNFPGDYPAGAVKGDTNELYGAIGYKKWVTAKYSYSLGNTFGIDKAKGTNYIELNGAVPLAMVTEGLRVDWHVGRQTFKGATADTIPTLNYTDYKLGITEEIKGYEIGLAYSKTNAKTGPGTYYHILGKDLGKGAAILSVAHAF